MTLHVLHFPRLSFIFSFYYHYFHLLDILSAMNANADPCDDFYEYACGKWIEKSSIPESKSSWSQFYVVDQNNEIIMKRLILEDKDKTRAQYKDVSYCLNFSS